MSKTTEEAYFCCVKGNMGRMNKILLIDDEPQIIQDILLSYGYQVDIAIDGFMGLQALLKPNIIYDLVVLDIQLPKMDGWAVLKAIREGEDCPNILVIMLTSHDTEQSMITGLRRGADLYMTKPVTPGVLLAQMEALLRRTQWDQDSNNQTSASVEVKNDGLLTQREMEIMKFILQGLTNHEIGENLAITETTVRNHLANIYKKLNVSNRNQAAFMAQKLKLF